MPGAAFSSGQVELGHSFLLTFKHSATTRHVRTWALSQAYAGGLTGRRMSKGGSPCSRGSKDRPHTAFSSEGAGAERVLPLRQLWQGSHEH